MKRRKYFTLIELLVVIAIIAILAAILMPSLNKALTRARSIACVSNLKQFGTAAFMYEHDSQWLPIAQEGSDPGFKQNLWHQKLRPYLGATGTVDNWDTYTKFLKKYTCPGISSRGSDTIGYGVSGFGCLASWFGLNPYKTNGTVSDGSTCYVRSYSKTADIQPSRIIFIIDAGHSNSSANTSKETRSALPNADYLTNKADVIYDFRHGMGTYNTLLLAGNVRTVIEPVLTNPVMLNYSMFLNK